MTSQAPTPAAQEPVVSAGSLLKPSASEGSTTPSIVSTAAANASEISMATALGACSGYATKKLAKTGGLIVGLGFIGVQALVHADVLKVNWPKVEGLLIGRVDQDGDGKLTHKDMQIATGRLLRNLVEDVPSSTGFAAAFFLGFRYG
ncbi:hypothetical protein PhCBS80983_g02252 [Powellomyces hirtus]|uniref:EF-hand domain-containing protein n=1 Tax=Powellomyces hirtus TaxID=109895 RepID=A0A507E9W2_9FUNG|nr:hypothetical protein PhCBS80983_g02252 [Powellomyces hirtus]